LSDYVTNHREELILMKTLSMMFALMMSCTALEAAAPRENDSRTSYPAPPIQCARMQGLWEGECQASPRSSTYPSRLQVFQDGCTDVALYDFDYPIPLHFRLGRESTTRHADFMNGFSSVTRYSDWSDDRSTFTSKGIFSSQYNYPSTGKTPPSSGEQNVAIAIKDGVLRYETSVSHRTEKGMEPSYNTFCEYRKISAR
jgi:hypothetical protein